MKKAALIIAIFFTTHAFADEGAKINWVKWEPDLFAKAAAQKRLVILDLQAIWCHWCHVMDEQTYSDPKVIEIINANYIAVQVDQDSRPDLSNRYENWGWPATVLFDSHGEELAKRAGFIEPKAMASMLQAFVDDPTPGPSAAKSQQVAPPTSPYLAKDQQKKLYKDYLGSYDKKQKGWGTIHKYVQRENIELALLKGPKSPEEVMAKDTLKLGKKLIDPVWGGVYQYSVNGWDEPHFEKIISFQADNIAFYSWAYERWHDETYLQNASDIRAYLVAFLKDPDGAFYTSQDADVKAGEHSAAYFKLEDKARREIGFPRVDKHIYSRENAWASEALAELYAGTGDERFLSDAIKPMTWIISHRSLNGGGFSHSEKDEAGPYLGDNVAMARAFAKLYSVTGDRAWLAKAEETMKYIDKTFGNFDKATQKIFGYATSKTSESSSMKPVFERDENIMMARTANILFHFTAAIIYKKMAEQAMSYAVADQNGDPASVLVADNELTREPLHLTVVGGKDDKAAKELFKKAIAFPSTYKRTEWWDKREGAMPRADVTYPTLDKAAIFICTASRCSLPIFDAKVLHKKIEDSIADAN